MKVKVKRRKEWILLFLAVSLLCSHTFGSTIFIYVLDFFYTQLVTHDHAVGTRLRYITHTHTHTLGR